MSSFAPVQSVDQVKRALTRLLWQFQNKPRLRALLSSYIAQVQRVEDAAWEVAFYRSIDDGFGATLDMVGKLVGRGRNGLQDDDYRVALRCQIRINKSDGSLRDLLRVVALSDPTATTEIYETGAAAFTLSTNSIHGAQVAANALQVKPVGVAMTVFIGSGPHGTAFAVPFERWGWSQDSAVGNASGWSQDSTVGAPLAYEYHA